MALILVEEEQAFVLHVLCQTPDGLPRLILSTSLRSRHPHPPEILKHRGRCGALAQAAPLGGDAAAV